MAGGCSTRPRCTAIWCPARSTPRYRQRVNTWAAQVASPNLGTIWIATRQGAHDGVVWLRAATQGAYSYSFGDFVEYDLKTMTVLRQLSLSTWGLPTGIWGGYLWEWCSPALWASVRFGLEDYAVYKLTLPDDMANPDCVVESRVSQLVVEQVLGPPIIRVSQLVAERLSGPAATARVSQLVVEAVRDSVEVTYPVRPRRAFVSVS